MSKYQNPSNQGLVKVGGGFGQTIYGTNAGNSAATGTAVTIFGELSGNALFGDSSTFVGYWAGQNSTGIQNTFVGSICGRDVTSGTSNCAFGFRAMGNGGTVTGNNNIAIGSATMGGGTIKSGSDNTMLGNITGSALTTGNFNIGIGYQVFTSLSAGLTCIAIGYQTATNVTIQENIIAIGNRAAYNCAANNNIGIGYQAGYGLANQNNVCLGTSAGFGVGNASNNVAIGLNAMQTSGTGDSNIAIGNSALNCAALSGDGNIAIGSSAGSNQSSGSNSVYIASPGAAAESGAIRIGTDGTHTDAYITGIFGNTVGGSGVPVVIDTDDQLGTIVSSRRFKDKIVDLHSSRVMELKPVSFEYKKYPGIVHCGLIAEDVSNVMPELVVNDDEGKPMAVKYHDLPVLLLNEMQKMAQRIVELEARLK